MNKFSSNPNVILHQYIDNDNPLDGRSSNKDSYSYTPLSDSASKTKSHRLSDNSAILPANNGISQQLSEFSTDNARLKGLKIASKTVYRADLINDKYLPADLLNNLIEQSGKHVILIAAGLGVGKSTAAAALMRDHYGARGVAVSHRVKLTGQLCAAFDADNYEAVKKLDAGESCDRLGTTIQSLPFMVNSPFCHSAFDDGLLVIDESNSVAAEFTGKTIKNEAQTMRALKTAINKAARVLCLDAHIDSSTVDLLLAAGVKRSDILLIEVQRPELEGYTVKVFDTGKDPDQKAAKSAAINQIINDLRAGLKVMAASLSASFLDALERRVDEAGLFGAIKITGDSKREVFNSLNADTYGNYTLVMLSPAMSTGISFDRHHADTCYVYLSNNDGTGSYQDGLQAMMRDRAVKSKVINCIYEESNKPIKTADQVMIDKDRNDKALSDYLSNHCADYDQVMKAFNHSRPDHERVSGFLWGQMVKQATEKLSFLKLFIAECELKGATIQRCQLAEFAAGEVTPELLSEDKQQMEAARIKSIIHAEKMPDDTDLIDDTDLRAMKTRARVEAFAAVDFDQMDTESKTDLVKKIAPEDDQKSIISRIRNFERAALPAPVVKRMVEIAVFGASADDSDQINFAEKITTSKIHWEARAHYTNLVLKACGVTSTDNGLVLAAAGALTEQSVRTGAGAGLYRSLKQNPERAITCGMLGGNVGYSDIEHIRANPFPYLISMIDKAGVKLKKARGKDQYTVCSESLGADIDLINRRKAAGVNEAREWLDRIDEYLQSHQSRKAKKLALDANVTESAPAGAVEAISKALDSLGASHLLGAAVEYLEPFHSRIEKRILSMTNIHLIVSRFVDSQ